MEQPEWLAYAWDELGQSEVSGARDNPRIRAFYKEVGQSAQHHDEVPWCAAFVGACLERSGLDSTRSLMARSYLGWGGGMDDGRFGAVTVLSRGSDPAAGHVGFLLGATGSQLVLLGGNQTDAVTVARFPKSRLLGFRWPKTLADTAHKGADFERALVHVLEMEGGFTEDPYDPGGPTNQGITLKVFAAWKGVRLDAGSQERLKAELKNIPEEAVRDIYAARYWRPGRCDDLPPALAFFHFDASVNHGVTGAARLLQEAVGTDVDGEIGPLTLAASKRLSVSSALENYADVRRRRYRALPHFWRFGRGWLARVDKTLARARQISTQSDQTPDNSSATQKGPSNMPTSSQSKWWGESMTVWGAIITGLTTVLPALGPAIGVDITADLVREVGEQIVQTVQGFGGLVGIAMTIFGRIRASVPLERRAVSMKL